MTRAASSVVALVLVSVCVATPARAHLMPKQQATVNLRDSAAFAAFSIPVTALRDWDDNHDGRMSTAEFVAHRAAIAAQLDAGIHIVSASDAGTRALLLPSVEFDEGDSLAARGGTHLLVLVRQSFDRVPVTVQLELTLFGSAADEQQFIVKATKPGAAPEVVILSRGSTQHLFFAPPRVLVAMASLAKMPFGIAVFLLLIGGGMVRLGRALPRSIPRACAEMPSRGQST